MKRYIAAGCLLVCILSACYEKPRIALPKDAVQTAQWPADFLSPVAGKRTPADVQHQAAVFYEQTNAKYFNNELPQHVQIKFMDLDEGTYGLTDVEKQIIYLNGTYIFNDMIWKWTLLHEMCHFKHPHHEKAFKDEIKRLVAAGAYEDIL